jgi:hypothetical protein
MRYADWKSHGTQLLYSGGVDSIVRIYDLNTFKEKGIINGWNPTSKTDI